MNNTFKKSLSFLLALLLSFSVFGSADNFTASAASAISIKKQPTLKASKIKAASVKLSWSKVKTATSYKLYRSTNKKKWKLVKTTEKTSYTVKKLKSGKKYYFRVRAIGKNKKSPYSKVLTVKTITINDIMLPKSIYVSHNYKDNSDSSVRDINAIDISWSKSKGADGFRIYKYNEENNQWTKIKDIKKRNFVFKHLKPSTTYKFAIRPYISIDNEIILTKNKKTITASTLPDKIENLKTEFIDNTTLKVTWKKQSSDTVKYNVFYSTGYNGTSKLVKTTSKNNCIIKNLNKKNGYVIGVVAYNEAGKTKFWGDSSYITVPKIPKNRKLGEGKFTIYELNDGKWIKTTVNVIKHEDGNSYYYYTDYGTCVGFDHSNTIFYPGFIYPMACERCGLVEDCTVSMSGYNCIVCEEFIGNGTCHPSEHYEKSH